MANKNFYLFLAIAWTLLMAVLCLVSFKKLPAVAELPGADKYAHITFHFVFTILWYLYFRMVAGRKWLLLKVFLASLCYGISIEIMQQLFTDTRKADINDVAANCFGATLAVLAMLLYGNYLKRKAL
ncbi:MAG TPA: VanZ family protein [Flavobacterium sp.]|nr:VanZ family protein [Flavobacterium sp.]